MSTILVVSPHLDDAVMSVGGAIHTRTQRGDRVIAATMFAGIPAPPYSKAADNYHQIWKLRDDPVGARRKEDIAALQRLGAEPHHSEFLDAIYRRFPDGGWLVGDANRPVSHQETIELDADLTRSISKTVASLVQRFCATVLVTCAAIGSHVDHLATRNGVILAAEGLNVPVFLWEDLPYGATGTAVPSLPRNAKLGERLSQPVCDSAWRNKIDAVACYSSQLEMLRDSSGDIFRQLTVPATSDDSSLVGAYVERFWSLEWVH